MKSKMSSSQLLQSQEFFLEVILDYNRTGIILNSELLEVQRIKKPDNFSAQEEKSCKIKIKKWLRLYAK